MRTTPGHAPNQILWRILGVVALIALVAATDSASNSAILPAAEIGYIGLRIIDVPLDAQADPRARLYIVDHLAPGTVIDRRIEVSNTTASTAHIGLYSAAATISLGSFVGADGHTLNDLSTWTSIAPGSIDLQAGGTKIAIVTITVPTDAAPGEQYGVVWAEVSAGSPGSGGVTQVSRVGIRIYLSVGPGGPPAANFRIDSLTAKRAPDGQPIVIASVHNTGGRALDISGTLQLSAGPGGLNAGPFPANLGTTLGIGDTEPVTITLDKQIPAGPWDAVITLRSGLLEVTAQATVTFPNTGAAPAVKTTPAVPGWLYPSIAGLILSLLLGMTTLIFLQRRRRRLAVTDPDPPAGSANG